MNDVLFIAKEGVHFRRKSPMLCWHIHNDCAELSVCTVAKTPKGELRTELSGESIDSLCKNCARYKVLYDIVPKGEIRTCMHCGCRTNARVRACCKKAQEEDRANI